ncbi:MAG: SGNH/GDSL hydrolase family protein [Candidatus Binatia bacterium]
MAPTYHVANAVFQPYFGYTLRPGREDKFAETRTWRANNFGFQHLVAANGAYCCDYPFPHRESELIVGIFGGSVGSGYALFAELSGGLADGLRRVPGWENKEIRILNFAQPGFKQPQQLFTYAYFLSIGQEFDLVINIDGFNEVVTTWRNWESGVEPNYPADTLWGAWGRQLEQYDLPVSERGFLLSNYHRISAQAARQDARGCPFATCRYVLLALARYHQWRAAANAGQALTSLTERSYFPTKTFSPLPQDLDIYRYTAALWRNSSTAMHVLARENGTLYLHILQPNQWYEPAGPYEPIDPKHPYGWVIGPVNKGYAALRSESARLRQAGVHFVDLTLMFADRPAREVYSDDCCHYTPAGYELVFEASAAALADIVGKAE